MTQSAIRKNFKNRNAAFFLINRSDGTGEPTLIGTEEIHIINVLMNMDRISINLL